MTGSNSQRRRTPDGLRQTDRATAERSLRERIEDLLLEAATALSTLHGENKQLRAELEYEREHANAYYEECGQWEAENEKLRAENIRWGQDQLRGIKEELKRIADELERRVQE